jgi:hypothetical protein
MNDIGGTLNLINPYTAGKNAIINGAFNVWQRGTSIALAASTSSANGFTSDRWQTSTGANQATTISRQATGDTTNLPFIQYCLRFQRNSGQTGTAEYAFLQNIDTPTSIPFAGRTVTLSFYARAGANYSATSSILQAILKSGTGTDQNLFSGFTGSTVVINQNATLTTTWQRFSYSATVAATATQLGVQYAFTPVGTASTNDYFEITGVQLEIGSTATPFQTASGTIGGELALCQRYCQRFGGVSVMYYAMGQGQTTTQALFTMSLFVPLRTTPSSITVSAAADFHVRSANADTNLTNLVLDVGSPTVLGLSATVASGLTVGRAYNLQANANTTNYIQVEAEL